ncbi:MAG: 7TM-DISM domain-containing protein [Bacteroidota bacterium]
MKYTNLSYLLLLFTCLSNSYSQSSAVIVGSTKPINIHKNLFHYKDSTNNTDIFKAISIQKKGSFTQLKSKTTRQEFGFNTSNHWYYFHLKAINQIDLMLELEYNNIDDLELFELKNGNIHSIGKSGDNFDFSIRPFPNNNYVFPIRLAANENAQYFLNIKQPNSILSFTIELLPRAKFIDSDRREYLGWGIFIGIICIVLVVNMVMWLASGDKIYMWYILYVHFMTMHLFADAGLAFQYLWDKTPIINSYHPVYLYIWLGLIVQVIFMQNFINQNASNSKVFKWLVWFRRLVLACFAGIILIRISNWPFGNLYLFKSIAFISSLFVPIIFILTIISLYERRHDKEVLVKYYGWAIIIQFIGYLFVAFVTYIQTTNINFSLPFDILSYITIGSILLLDILFFSFGLSYRYRSSLKTNQKLALELVNNTQSGQRKVITALENERKRLAQDLHDDLGATLSTAKGYISMIAREKHSDTLVQSGKILDKVSDELRSVSHRLMPKDFNKVGLKNAIEESINKVASANVAFEFYTFGEIVKLEEQTEMIIFGIATDLINRVQNLKSARNATVQLIYHETFLNLSIEHNGIITKAKYEHFNNLYLKASFINGDLIIDDDGNSIILSVPF